MAEHVVSLVIAPSRQVLRDVKGNVAAVLVAILVLLSYVAISSLIMRRFESWSYLHAAYFTVINVTTVGFGDVTATTHAGKVLSGINAFAGLILFGALVALITLAFQPGEFTGSASLASVSPSYESDDGTPGANEGEAVTQLLRGLTSLLKGEQGVERRVIRVAPSGKEEGVIFIEILLAARRGAADE